MNTPLSLESTHDVLRCHGVDRRDFLRFCVTTAAAMGLEASMVPQVVSAMENKPRIPVLWLHGLECSCCSESFIRSSHPLTRNTTASSSTSKPAIPQPSTPPSGIPPTSPRKPRVTASRKLRAARLVPLDSYQGHKIANYQIVVPSTWNASPRDDKGQVGAYESALLGTPVANPNQPLEILRTIHSFDPCLACAAHMLSKDGRKLSEVMVRV